MVFVSDPRYLIIIIIRIVFYDYYNDRSTSTSQSPVVVEGNPIHRGAPEPRATADGAEAHVLTLSEPVMHLGRFSALCHPRRLLLCFVLQMRAPECLWKQVLQVLLLQVLPRAARRPAALCSAIRTTLRPLVVVHEAGNPGRRGCPVLETGPAILIRVEACTRWRGLSGDMS